MLVDVLVPHVLVGLQPQAGHLRQHHVGHAGVHQQLDPAPGTPGTGRQHELGQLVPDPLGGDHLQPGGQLAHGRGGVRGHREPQLRGEPGGAHDPQRVVAERFLRAPRRAQHLAAQVPQAAERVDQVERGQPGGHGVHGEVPAAQVRLQGRAVADAGGLA